MMNCNVGILFSRKVMTVTRLLRLGSGWFCFSQRWYPFVRTFFLLVVVHTELSEQKIVFLTVLRYWELSC